MDYICTLKYTYITPRHFGHSIDSCYYFLTYFTIFSHIPKAKATAIADTPELKRIAENTKIQSNVKYHADFEKQKGKLTQVCIDSTGPVIY